VEVETKWHVLEIQNSLLLNADYLPIIILHNEFYIMDQLKAEGVRTLIEISQSGEFPLTVALRCKIQLPPPELLTVL
jgi:hypothetical protein